MYLTGRFYTVITLIILTLCGGYIWLPLFTMGKVLLVSLILVLLTEARMLYSRKGVHATRHCSGRFSNGNDNAVRIPVENNYPFSVNLEVIDEIPILFQYRNVSFPTHLVKGGKKVIEYSLRPVKRGEYTFGFIRLFVTTRAGLLSRRITCGEEETIKVYPSYLMLHQYELLAMSNNLTELGIKKIRRIGHHTEFEQIKEYIKGDDYRTINWSASARKHQIMVNVYQDERSQQIFNVIDKGRMMQQAFRGMTLLDYAINASLVLSYIAIHKDDKAGLVTFNENFDTFVPASKQSNQMHVIMDSLYSQKTSFGETDYSALCAHLGKHVQKRSFLILYTNFANMGSLRRQLSYLQQLARRHCLLVVFFEDADLSNYIQKQPGDTEGYYRNVIAERFVYEKRLIISTLKQYGIYSLLTTPENLSVDVINKYLQLRAAKS